MGDPTADKPTVEELVTKALAAEAIDQEFAAELGGCDLEEALGMFYGYMLEKGGDPDALLAEWGIIEPE